MNPSNPLNLLNLLNPLNPLNPLNHMYGRTVALVTTAALAVMWSRTTTSTASIGTDVVTYHNDIARTGQNLTESTLSPDQVVSRRRGHHGAD